MNYTKGKWEFYREGNFNFGISNDKGRHVADISKNANIPTNEKEANAKLIAASPKLYEALLCLTAAIRPHVMKMNIKKSFNEHVALNAADKVLYELTGKVFGTIEPDHPAPTDHNQEKTKLYSIREHDGANIISFTREKDGCYFELGRTVKVVYGTNSVLREGRITNIYESDSYTTGLAIEIDNAGVSDASLLQHVTPIY